eukprot:TRINITY_DN5295_c0_g1_i1.p1 TRINITY_DN5295_c0_g1~~TRINITY_DN5295_c0_g1_i1.p1  ORF type:complete len:387 (+),score=74.85 TRINITY_DN5295_c0_g1_i1:44-1204(+)
MFRHFTTPPRTFPFASLFPTPSLIAPVTRQRAANAISLCSGVNATSTVARLIAVRMYKTKREERVRKKDRLKELHRREARRGLYDSEHSPFPILWDATDPYHNQKLIQRMDSNTLCKELLRLGIYRVRQVQEYPLESPENYLDEAIISIEKGLAVMKKSNFVPERKLLDDGYLSYAIAHYYLNKPKVAIDQLNELLKSSHHHKIELWLGHNYRLAGEYVNAIHAYTKFLDKHKVALKNPLVAMYNSSLIPQATLHRGNCYSVTGDFRKAHEDFSTIIEMQNSTDRITLSIAYYLRADNEIRSTTEKNWTQIVNDCTEAIRADSHMLDAFWMRAQAYEALGKSDAANYDREFHRQLCKLKLQTLPKKKIPSLEPRITKDMIESRART